MIDPEDIKTISVHEEEKEEEETVKVVTATLEEVRVEKVPQKIVEQVAVSQVKEEPDLIPEIQNVSNLEYLNRILQKERPGTTKKVLKIEFPINCCTCGWTIYFKSDVRWMSYYNSHKPFCLSCAQSMGLL